ncbi:MAG: hypothetical protein ACRDHM_04505 [Actinomycetota bacterium]
MAWTLFVLCGLFIIGLIAGYVRLRNSIERFHRDLKREIRGISEISR